MTPPGPTPARALRLWSPPVLWMAALFFASASSGPGGGLSVPDWITHGTAYLVLAVLLARAVSGARWEALTPRLAALVVLISTVYGVTDEYHQSFVPGRDSSAGDVAKDLGGSVVGVLVFGRLGRQTRDDGTETRRRA